MKALLALLSQNAGEGPFKQQKCVPSVLEARGPILDLYMATFSLHPCVALPWLLLQTPVRGLILIPFPRPHLLSKPIFSCVWAHTEGTGSVHREMELLSP